MDKVCVGIVGAGFIGQTHASDYRGCADAEVVAICDVVEERARAFAKEHNIPQVFTDYEKMVVSDDIDAVSVAVPNIYHAPVTIAGFQAGKHVLCEKPLTVSPKDADAMLAAAEESGKVFGMALPFRHYGNSQLLKAVIEEGTLGEIYYAKASMLRMISIPKGWFHMKKYAAGGPLFDLAPHILDATWWYMGCPKPVSASGATFAKFGPEGKGMGSWGIGWPEDAPATSDVEDLACGLIRFEDGQVIYLDVSWVIQSIDGTADSTVYGTKAGATFAAVPNTVEVYTDQGPVDIPEAGPNENPYARFIEAIVGKKSLLGPGKDGVVIIKILDAIYRSAESGKEEPITL